MKNTTETPASVIIECDLPDPPKTVWRALTDQNLLGAWLMPNDIRPEVGAHFSFRPETGASTGSPIDCEVLEAEPNRLLRWRQSERSESDGKPRSLDSVVTFELSDTPTGGTHLRLIHDGFQTGSTEVAQRFSAPKACATVIPFKVGELGAHSQGKKARTIVCLLAPLRRAA
jgi:uncharacterized protein YndB with AHSA1/START domain